MSFTYWITHFSEHYYILVQVWWFMLCRWARYTEDGGLPPLSFLPVPLCHYASEQFISNWILFQRCDLKALLTSSISSVKTLLSNWKVFMSFSLLSIYSNLLSWHIQQDTDVFMITCANLLFYNKVIDGTIIKWIASQFIYQFGVTYTHHISWIK
jgi:hypothetical protein